MPNIIVPGRESDHALKVSVIDIGFNSIKMVNYEVGRRKLIRVCGEFGIKTRLGEGLVKRRTFAPAAVKRTVDALEICREIIRAESIRHAITVGTSPFREAENRDEFLRLIFQKTGFRIRVLSSGEEALYSLFGAMLSTGRKTSLFFDLGGGSLEIVYLKNFRIRRLLSLPLGSLRLTELYAGRDGNFTEKNYSRMEKHITESLPDRNELGLSADAALVGVGGTVRALARYDQEKSGYPFDKIHNFTVRSSSIEKAKHRFSRTPVKKLQNIQSFGEGRASTVTAGSAVVAILMKKLGLKELVVSTHGLRDGILTSFISGHLYHDKDADLVASIERHLKSAQEAPTLRKSDQMIRAFEDNGAINSSESLILTHLVRNGIDREPASSPEFLFYKLMGEDCTLSPGHQLVLALSAVRCRNARASDRLLVRYGKLLSEEERGSISKIASCQKFIDLIEKGCSAVNIKADRCAINIRVYPGVRFPEKLFKRTARNVRNNLVPPLRITVIGLAPGLSGRNIYGMPREEREPQ